MKESWKNIPGYDGKYQADINGNVRHVYASGKTRLLNPYHKKTNKNSRLVIKLTKNRKAKEVALLQIMAKTFLGVPPEDYVPYHKNGCKSDNYIQNIAYISRKELGKRTGKASRRQPVAKINSSGEIVETYASAREAARKNFMNRQTIADRCNGKCKRAFASDGYEYAWEDKEVSIRRAIRRIKQSS